MLGVIVDVTFEPVCERVSEWVNERSLESDLWYREGSRRSAI